MPQIWLGNDPSESANADPEGYVQIKVLLKIFKKNIDI